MRSCDGNTYEMVECLKAQTAQWDKRMGVAYQQAMQDATPQRHDQLRAAQRLWNQYRDANCLYYGLGEGSIARIDAGECMRSMTEARPASLRALVIASGYVYPAWTVGAGRADAMPISRSTIASSSRSRNRA